MKSKDKKLAQYEIEARRARRASKDAAEYNKDLEAFSSRFVELAIRRSNEGITEEEQRELERMADSLKYTWPTVKNRIENDLNKLKKSQKEDLDKKRKRYEQAMKAAAEKKKQEQNKTE